MIPNISRSKDTLNITNGEMTGVVADAADKFTNARNGVPVADPSGMDSWRLFNPEVVQ